MSEPIAKIDRYEVTQSFLEALKAKNKKLYIDIRSELLSDSLPLPTPLPTIEKAFFVATPSGNMTWKLTK